MKERGFSLLEVVIVMVLLGLTAALMAPSFSRFSKSIELKTTAKKVAAILRYCRSEAVSKGKVHQVSFDSNLMVVKAQSIETEDPKETGQAEPRTASKSFSIPPGVQMKELNIESTQYPADLPAIEFYPNGGSNGGDFILDAQGLKGFKIKVNFLTGTVVIERV